MKPVMTSIAAGIAAIALLGGCANTGSGAAPAAVGAYPSIYVSGAIASIEYIPAQDVIIAGFVGGPAEGQSTKAAALPDSYRVRVRMDDGQIETLTQSPLAGLAVGDRVIVADNQAYRNDNRLKKEFVVGTLDTKASDTTRRYRYHNHSELFREAGRLTDERGLTYDDRGNRN